MKPSTELTIGRMRGRVPRALRPTVVDVRTRLAWRSEAVRKDAREQMRFLVERTRPDVDLDTVARDYARFQAFRGDDWMQEPCRSCSRKSIDFGGCRCQAFALIGDATATDPVCTLSPKRSIIDAAIRDADGAPAYRYRYISLQKAETH